MRISRKSVVSSLILTLVLASFLFAQHAKSAAENRIQERVASSTQSASVSISPFVRVPDALLRVAFCESGNHQTYPDGSVVIGKITPDIGRFQINPVHLIEARKHGMDVYTLEGNTAYALLLYKRNGLRDWHSSESCWSSLTELRKKGYQG